MKGRHLTHIYNFYVFKDQTLFVHSFLCSLSDLYIHLYVHCVLLESCYEPATLQILGITRCPHLSLVGEIHSSSSQRFSVVLPSRTAPTWASTCCSNRDAPFRTLLSRDNQIQIPNIFVQNTLTLGGSWLVISLHPPIGPSSLQAELRRAATESKMPHSKAGERTWKIPSLPSAPP